MILPVFSRQNWCYSEFVLESFFCQPIRFSVYWEQIGWKKNEFEHKFTVTPILARKNGQNHDIESIHEPNIKSARYVEQEERVLARIIFKIKESY